MTNSLSPDEIVSIGESKVTIRMLFGRKSLRSNPTMVV